MVTTQNLHEKIRYSLKFHETTKQHDLGGGQGPPDAHKILIPHRIVHKIKI